MELDDDIIRFTLRNPAYRISRSSKTEIMESPDRTAIYNLIESYIVAETIFGWLRIAGYEFVEGPESALESARTLADSKMALLKNALSPATYKRSVASPRQMPPLF